MAKNEMEQIEDEENKVKKLVDWENPPSVEDLRKNLTAAEPSHSEQVKKIDVYLDNLAGKLGIKIPKGRSKYQPKLIRTQAEWRYSALEDPFLETKDMFEVSPRTYEDGQGAKENKLVLNYQWNTKIDKIAFINEYVRAATDEGTAIIQVGWDFEEEMREVEVDIEASPAQAQQILMQRVQAGQISQEEAMAQFQSGEPLILGTRKEDRLVVIKNQPTYRICEYQKCVIDPTCEGDVDKAQFIVMPFETSQAALRTDKSYDNLHMLFTKDRELIDSDSSDTDFMSEQEKTRTFKFEDGARQKLTAYEYFGYWDIHGNGTTKAIKAVWANNTMIKLEELPYPDRKLPFVAVQYLPVRKSIYGEPDGELLKDKQDIMGATYRGMIDVMGRSANGQTGMQKGMLDVANQKKFDNGEHFFYNQGFDPKSSIHMTTFNEIPNSALQMIQLQHQDSESLTGVKSFGGGLAGGALGPSVGGGRMVLDSASKRELGILRRLGAGIEKLGRKTIAMNAVWLDDEEVIRVTNEEFRTVDRDDLAGEYDLKLTISTSEANNQKAEELAFMLQTTAQSSDPGEVRMIRAEIARLRGMPELAKRIEDFKPEPDPRAEQQADLQIALLQAQVFNEQAKGRENAVDVELKTAKVASEYAKAGKTDSEKDSLNLDFLRKESGAGHTEEMDKKGFDHSAKMSEKMFDVQNKPRQGLGT